MEQYIVSARKYRPSDFRSVIGQKALTETLKNAILTNHLAHAYLFCGPRGVGKTTCARIFAKTINCMNLNEQGEACNACESCKSFNEQRSFNIHELDAASNNSVDDIRNLVEQVRVPPQIGRYSVYIIDEVHMLSNQAFNAFLKTLEEPPAHAIFILATTEKHKIIPTILSRCQIYDFNRIKIADMVEYLQYVCEQEHITAQPEALNIIAQKADGAMRDALSIFDQVVSFCGSNVTYDQVIAHLNILDYDYYFKLVEAFLNHDVPAALLIFNEVLNKGFEAQHFISGLAAHLRDVMVCKDPQTVTLLEVGASIAEKYVQQATLCTPQFLYAALELANECDLNYRQSKNKRLLVEVLLIRLCSMNVTADTLKKAKPELMKIAVNTASAKIVSKTASLPTASSQPTVAPVQTQQDLQKSSDQASPTKTAMKFSLPKRNTTPSANQNIAAADGESQTRMSSSRVHAEPTFTSIPLEKETLLKAWQHYGKQIDKEAHTTNTMYNFKPTIVDDNTIEVVLVNPMQVDALERHKLRIERFLEQELQHDPLTLNIRIDTSQQSKVALTPEEWLLKITEQNKDFKELRTLLKLEVM